MSAPVIGIDLGTTNSVVSVLEGGEPSVIANQEGKRVTPSVVAFQEDGTCLVGEAAKRQASANPDRTIFSVKRHMGTRWNKKIDGKEYTPEEISARILRDMKKTATAYLGVEAKEAVITVPAYFNDAQRTATKDAGKIAGLEVLRIINEPTAAALAYGTEAEKDQKIIVFDLGGGTLDVSILSVADGVFSVEATSGDTNLGGNDWDAKIADWLAEDFKDEHGIDLRDDSTSRQRLIEAAEQAKIDLSKKQETTILLPFITSKDGNPLNLETSITRTRFEDLTKDLLEKCREPFKKAVEDSGFSMTEIDELVLVGGSTRMPQIVELVRDMSGKSPSGSKGANPDEAISLGACLQAGIVSADPHMESKSILLLDVTPLSLGIDLEGDVISHLIEKNSTIPISNTQTYTTASHNQSMVEIVVRQGERMVASKNKLLGKFTLSGIRPAPRGVPRIVVTFDIDVDGIVNVSAKDEDTGEEQSIVITGQTRLTDDEIKQKLEEAEKHDAEDRARATASSLRADGDGVIIRLEAFLSDYGSKLDATRSKKLNEAKESMLESLSGDVDVSSAKAAIAALDTELAEAVSSVGIKTDNSSSSSSASESKSAYANA